MKLLFVGDPHVERKDRADAQALVDYVFDVAHKHQAVVLLSGDLYHTHGVIDADVQYFWYNAFDRFRQANIPVIALKGNHDEPAHGDSDASSLVTHIEQAQMVIWQPYRRNGILFCPYTDAETLYKWSAEATDCMTLICHGTFDGSRYENGFFAGDAMDQNRIIQPHIISGHIHTPQAFGKVVYPGAPRWRTLSDANTARAIWLFEFDALGNPLRSSGFDTGLCCRQIVHLIDTFDDPIDPVALNPLPKNEYRIDIKGSEAFIQARKPVFAGWAKVRTIRTDVRARVRVKESEGVGVAFSKWVDAFKAKNGTESSTLRDMARSRIHGLD